MNQRMAVVAVLMIVLVAAVAAAQDAPVTLRYKYTPGETRHIETTTSGVMPMTIDATNAGGGEAAVVALDMNLNTTVLMDEVCKAVDDRGVASLEMTMPEITSRVTQQVGNQTIDAVFEWKNGVATRTVNGQAVPDTDEIRQATEALKATMKMQVTPTGQSTLDPETVKVMAKLGSANGGMGGMDMGSMNSLMAALPEGPVKVGDGWAAEQETRAMGLTLQGTCDLKLVAIEQFEGRRAARIEGHATINSSGEAEPPAEPAEPAETAQTTAPAQTTNFTRLEMTIDFVNYLDLERGVVLCSTMNVCQNMAMVISQPAPKQGDPPITLPGTIDNGQLTVEVRLK